jgi:DNA (cytosine-5)-methyltransferase 1
MDLTTLSKTDLHKMCESLGITKCKSKKKEELIQLINNSVTEPSTESENPKSDLTKMSKAELISKCQELGITKCKSKNKKELIALIEDSHSTPLPPPPTPSHIEQPLDDGEDQLKFIDLFCGIGGFHQALSNIGFKCVFASDIDENCRKTYETNYGLKPHGDITKIPIESIPTFDILCAGFPCQPFSKAGFQKGFDDDRGNLFFNICNIARHHRPKYMILENVRNLSSHDNGNTWDVIRQHIADLGYITYNEPVLLNVLHFNIPQNRERVVIMCKRADLGDLHELPEITKHPKENLTCFIKDIIDEREPSTNLTGKSREVFNVWNAFIDILYSNGVEIPKFPIWTDWWDNAFEEEDDFYIKYTGWIDKNRIFYQENFSILEKWLLDSRNNELWIGAVRKLEWQAGNLTEENNDLRKCLWTARGSGIRVKKCDYIPTLVAMSMIPIYGPKNRKLTPIELLRLQSFNDTFKYDEKNIYKQLGNAVNVTMIERCARFLIFGEPLL